MPFCYFDGATYYINLSSNVLNKHNLPLLSYPSEISIKQNIEYLQTAETIIFLAGPDTPANLDYIARAAWNSHVAMTNHRLTTLQLHPDLLLQPCINIYQTPFLANTMRLIRQSPTLQHLAISFEAAIYIHESTYNELLLAIAANKNLNTLTIYITRELLAHINIFSAGFLFDALQHLQVITIRIPNSNTQVSLTKNPSIIEVIFPDDVTVEEIKAVTIFLDTDNIKKTNSRYTFVISPTWSGLSLSFYLIEKYSLTNLIINNKIEMTAPGLHNIGEAQCLVSTADISNFLSWYGTINSEDPKSKDHLYINNTIELGIKISQALSSAKQGNPVIGQLLDELHFYLGILHTILADLSSDTTDNDITTEHLPQNQSHNLGLFSPSPPHSPKSSHDTFTKAIFWRTKISSTSAYHNTLSLAIFCKKYCSEFKQEEEKLNNNSKNALEDSKVKLIYLFINNFIYFFIERNITDTILTVFAEPTSVHYESILAQTEWLFSLEEFDNVLLELCEFTAETTIQIHNIKQARTELLAYVFLRYLQLGSAEQLYPNNKFSVPSPLSTETIKPDQPNILQLLNQTLLWLLHNKSTASSSRQHRVSHSKMATNLYTNHFGLGKLYELATILFPNIILEIQKTADHSPPLTPTNASLS